ncbi:MAG TPA: adenine deaminase [Thermomicrobiales bacterium]|jgi:adenine deaminase|nr:adenine deaminase [Thermomicrobiales bacterium]
MTEVTPGLPAADLAAWRRRIAAALREEPADLVIRGGTVVDVLSGELRVADVAIAGGRIAAVGDGYAGTESIDATGRFIAPSFIDGHVHVESSLVWISEFARAVVPRGTGAVVTDPHEIANVAGLPGMRALLDGAADLPIRVAFTVPSCVPASPNESPGTVLGPDAVAEALSWPGVVGLGEMMNFPGLLAGDAEIGRKLASAGHLRRDGHAPGLHGDALHAYAAAGPTSDHESTELAEARDKLRAGLMVMIREGSSERNLLDLLPLVTDATYPRCCFASDDRDCHTLVHRGHVDDILRQAIAAGLDPVRAIRMATWNTADYWRLEGLGAVAPGYHANLVLLRDLATVDVAMTIYGGAVVARDGRLTAELPSAADAAPSLRHTVHVAPVLSNQFRLAPDDATTAVEVIPGQIVTRAVAVEPTVRDGWAVADPDRDLLKLVSVERYHATGRVGVGLVRGFGLKRGALASTIAHDAHNIVAVGTSDADILGAIAIVAESQGGLAVVADGQVIGHLPLPIAGLLSDQPIETVAAEYATLEEAARALGSPLDAPFGLLAFMSLSVIPEARVTDRGLLVL